ncbi:MAG: PorT family protein [Gemmatimonadales bacterium]|jgi:hypothetical protein|nr:MAG: PorT family protein [Gemmatimonadales bacterium]
MQRLLASIVLLATVTLVAETPRPLAAQLSLGINGGLTSSTFYGDDAEDTANETGFNIGASLAIPLGEGRLALAPGLYWVQKGTGIDLDGVDAAFSTAYIEIPVLLSVGLTPPESGTSFRVFGGPQVSFETACDVSASEGSISVEASCDDVDFTERTTTDFGLILGAMVGFPMGETLQLQLSGGVDFGLRTLDAETDPADLKNRSLFLNVGVAFPLGG